MATAFDQHYLPPVLSQQQVDASHQRYQAESQKPNTNGDFYSLPAMSSSTQTPSNSQTSNTPVEPSMADDVARVSAANVSPARGGRGGRNRLRGGRAPAKSKAKVAKVIKTAPNAKQGTGRGRRQKVYDYLKAQAAHERMAELKSHFTQLARAMKPALTELADRTLAKLTKNPTAHEKVPEAQDVHQFLDQRLADTLASADIELKMQVDNATTMYELNTRLAREECTEKILDAECEMYDALLAKLDRLEYLHDNNLPVDLRDASYQYKDITQQQVDQQGPYVHHSDDGVPVPCSERVVALSQIMNTSYQFADEHRGKRKAEEEAEGQPGAKRQGLLGLDDDAPRRTSALMSAHDDVAEGGRSATPGEEQQDAARKPTKPGRARGGAGAKQTLTASNGPVIEDKDEELLDVEEVNGLPLPKGASLPDEHGVRIITKSRKVEYANNRIMAPVASPFDDYQIGYRDSSNNPLKGATRARRREYLGQANSNAAFYDRRVANYNSVLQKEEDYDQQLVEKHNLHPTLGIFMPNSVNMSESSARKDLQEYKPVVQVGPNGQIFHASRSVPRHRLEQEAERIEQRLKLKAALSEFLAQEGIPEEEVAPSPEILQQHREAVLAAFDIDPATLTAAKETSTASQSPEAVQGDEHEAAKEPQRGIEELLQAARQVESEENASRMARNTASHKSSRPYDAIRDVFTENSPVVPAAHAPAPAAEALADNTYNLSFLAEIAENPDRAERMRQEEMRWAEIHRAERAAEAAEREHHFAMAEAFREDQAAHGQAQAEVSVMDPRLFPPHDVPHGNMHMAAAEAPQPQYPDHPHPHQYHSHDPASQWQREGTSVQSAGPPRGNDFLRTALNPQTPPPPTYPPPSYPPPPDYQVPLLGPAPPTQAPGTPFHSVAPQRGSLPALRPVRTSFDDGALAPEYQGSPGPAHRPSMVASNSGVYYPPAPPRPYHNGYMVEEQQMHPQQHHVGPPPHHQSMHPMAPTPAPYPQSPDNNGYGYPPLAPAPAAAAYQSPGAYSPIAQHPMTPVQAAGRGQPGGSSRPYRKLEPAPAQSANKPRAGAQRPELRTVQFDYREGIKDYVPLEPPPVHGPSSIRGWSHQNLKQRRASKEVPAPAPTDEPS